MNSITFVELEVDIEIQIHYTRNFDNRGCKLTKQVFSFHNNFRGFACKKRGQTMVAVSCKLIRVFYAVLTKGVDYDRFKMTLDIRQESNFIAV